MHKKRVFAIALAAVLLVVFGIGGMIYAAERGKTRSLIGQTGEIDRYYRDHPTGEIALKSQRLVINEDELRPIVEKNQLAGMDNPEESALLYLKRREMKFYLAVQNGCLATDDETRAAVEQEKENFRNAVNTSEFVEYLDGLGMTMEQYVDSRFEIYRKDESGNKFFEKWKKEQIDARQNKPWTGSEVIDFYAAFNAMIDGELAKEVFTEP